MSSFDKASPFIATAAHHYLMEHKARYIGDAVYVWNDGNHVVLCTSDGIDIKNVIMLEPAVLNNLAQYLRDTGIGRPVKP